MGGMDLMGCLDGAKVASMSRNARAVYLLFVASEIIAILVLLTAPQGFGTGRTWLALAAAGSVMFSGLLLKRTHPHLKFLGVFTAGIIAFQTALLAVED